MVETVFDVGSHGVFPSETRPSRKRAVSGLRDPCLPSIFVRGHPQAQRRLARMFVHRQPFSIMAACHRSATSSIASWLRTTSERCSDALTVEMKVMLAGHMDEIGFIVHYIDEQGYLYFQGIGGHDSAIIVPSDAAASRLIFMAVPHVR